MRHALARRTGASVRRARGVSAAIASLTIVAALLTGCATVPDYPRRVTLEREYRVERVRKSAGTYTVYPSGFVLLEHRGGARLYRERADDLLILVPVDPDGPVIRPSPPPALEALIPPTRGALQPRDIGSGLPRTGQWRDRFALAQLDGRPGLELVTAPSRKSGNGPQVFGFDPAAGWQRMPLAFVHRRYDYGSAAAGDFDADGRTDVAFAMHLVGFAAFVARDGGVEERSAGLPSVVAAPPGAGRALLSLPDADGDRLLLLREPMLSGPGDGLQEMALRDSRWHATGFSVARAAGDRMALSATPRCGTWLAVADVRAQAPRLWQRHDGAWREWPLAGFPLRRARIVDVGFGDIDGDGCDDLAVAYSPQAAGAWIGSVDVFLARNGDAWTRLPVWQRGDAAKPTALGLLPRTGGGAHLAVLDAMGGLRVFTHTDAGIVVDLDEPAPAWRVGCAGSSIAAGDIDGDGKAEWIAAFAGEPTSLAPSRCRNGGAFAAWKP